jgi:thioredoxin-like negative regulator of GroEL
MGWVLVVLLAAAGCRGPSPTEDEAAATTATAASPYRNLSEEATYVGRDVCKACHPDNHATFVESQMGRAFKAATRTNSIADFDDPDPIYNAEGDLYYQPFHQGEELFVREYRLVGRDTVHQRIEQIDFIVGSGHHTNSHMREVNGYLYQVPVTWYAQDEKWDLAPGFKTGGSSRFDRAIEVECMACHNGFPEYVPGSGNRFPDLPHGIGCERCHGPGSIHVEEKGAGIYVDTSQAIDYTIVNPVDLSIERQYDVCQRCHMQGVAVLKEGKEFLDFRPGMKLSDVMNVFWPRFTDSTSQFIMASHPDRLEMSECFKASHQPDSPYEPMTCITCHDPHLDIKTVPQERFAADCQTCHTPAQAPLCTEEEAVRAAQGDNCASCHMPESGSMDIPHVRITDHYIRVPDEGEIAPATPYDEKTFVRLASLIEDRPSARTVADGYLSTYEQFFARPQFLDSAAVYLDQARAEASDQELAPSLIRLWFLQGKHSEVRRLARSLPSDSLQDAWTLYRIGESYAKSGEWARVINYHEATVRVAPQHLRFKGKLADAYAASRRLDRALTLYDEILAANPTRADMYNNRGLARIARRDFQGAEADFEQALALNPDAEQALANLASLYYNTGRQDEARALAERLVRLVPDNPRYQQFLSLMQQ